MRRWLCALLGHALRPTGRHGSLLVEWRCARCGGRMVSLIDRGYGGPMLPRGKYDGMTVTVLPADGHTDRIVEGHRR